MTQDPAPVALQTRLPDQGPVGVTTPPARPASVPALAVVLVAVFGILLTSFPARNVDVWKHLAGGRDLLHGASAFGPTWLYDSVAYAIFSVGGGSGLVAVKALLC